MINRQTGFTLVELVLAFALVSSALVLVAISFSNIMRHYQQGVATRNTEQNARFAMEEIVRDIREASDIYASTHPNLPCFNKSGSFVMYYSSGGIIYKAPNCTGANAVRITDASVTVSSFALTSTTKRPASIQVYMKVTSSIGPFTELTSSASLRGSK